MFGSQRNILAVPLTPSVVGAVQPFVQLRMANKRDKIGESINQLVMYTYEITPMTQDITNEILQLVTNEDYI